MEVSWIGTIGTGKSPPYLGLEACAQREQLSMCMDLHMDQGRLTSALAVLQIRKGEIGGPRRAATIEDPASQLHEVMIAGLNLLH